MTNAAVANARTQVGTPVRPLPADCYVRLSGAVSLHIAPAFGLLRRPTTGESVLIGHQTREFLMRCDGQRRMRDLIDSYVQDRQYDADGLRATLAEVAGLVAKGLVDLDSTPRESPPPTSGDPRVHYPINLQVELLLDATSGASTATADPSRG